MAKRLDPQDYLEKAERKAVPASMQGWMREVQGVVVFLKKRPQLVETAGKEWFASMKAYNAARLQVLEKHVPPGMSKAQAHKLIHEAKRLL